MTSAIPPALLAAFPAWDFALATAALIVGIGVAWLFFALQTRRDHPLLAYRSFSWTVAHTDRSFRSHVSISFRGRAIPRLTRTRVVLWNAGWKAIQRNDVVAADPLALTFQEAEILEHTVVAVTRTSAGVTLDQDASRIVVNFALLDRHDGVVVDVLHTGREVYPTVTGTVAGMPEGARNFGMLDVLSLKRSRRAPLAFVAAISATTAATFDSVLSGAAALALGCGVFVGGLFAMTADELRWRRRAVPPQLRPALEQQ